MEVINLKTKKSFIKLFSLCLAIALLMSCLSFTVLAEDVSITASISYSYTAPPAADQGFTITITGTAGVKTKSPVYLRMVPSTVNTLDGINDGNTLASEDVITDNSGNYSTTFKALASTESMKVYNFIVFVGENYGYKIFPYTLRTTGDENTIVDAFNDRTPIADLEKAIKDYIEFLNVDRTEYGGTDSEIAYLAQVINSVAGSKTYQTIVEVETDVQFALAYNAISKATTGAGVKAAMDKYASILDLTELNGKSDAYKNAVYAYMVNYDFNSSESFKTAIRTGKLFTEIAEALAGNSASGTLKTLIESTYYDVINPPVSSVQWNKYYPGFEASRKGQTFIFLASQLKDIAGLDQISELAPQIDIAILATVAYNPDKGNTGGSSGTSSSGGGNITVGPGTAPPPEKFVDDGDIPEWAKSDVYALVKRGILRGYDDNTFRPNLTITRAEFATVLCKALELEPIAGGGTFTDTSNNEWYAPYIEALVKAGIVKGMSEDLFGATLYISREDAVTMIYRALQYSGITLPSGTPKSFNDAGDIADYARAAVDTLSAAGIVVGSDGNFYPDNNITRAEVVKIIANIF